MPDEPQEREERPRFTPQGRTEQDEEEAREQEAPADTPQARTDEEQEGEADE